ncbi:MAG: hypothetical protein ACRDZ3_11195 [Acidimicrobiia bacterium]
MNGYGARMQRLRALQLAGLVAVLVVSACGDPSTSSNPRNSDGAVGTIPSEDPPSPQGEPWTVATGGEQDGVRWTIFQTPGSDGTSCFAIEFDPPLPRSEINSPFPDGSAGMIPPPPFSTAKQYLEKTPYCITMADKMSESDPITVIHFPPEYSTNPFNVVVGQSASFVSEASILLESGSTAKIVSIDDLFVATYASEERLKSIQGTTKQEGTFSCDVSEAVSIRLIPGCSTLPPEASR